MRCAADMRGAAGKTNMHYMALYLSKYVNRAAIIREMGGLLTLTRTCCFAILDCTWGGCPQAHFTPY